MSILFHYTIFIKNYKKRLYKDIKYSKFARIKK